MKKIHLDDFSFDEVVADLYSRMFDIGSDIIRYSKDKRMWRAIRACCQALSELAKLKMEEEEK